MSSIRVLPAETANRIAAGEVIERPASVVKELIENSVDAGADTIRVRADQGGRKLIQVSDDGSGMDRDDAMLSIESHATSKVTESYDIDRISTLGFRGEALPSIAGVSRFRLRTRPATDTAGTEVLVDGGTLRDVKECGCPAGTEIRVQNLFFNLPARRKFLRQASTEEIHIQETVLLQALAQPAIGFELTMNGRQVIQVSSNIASSTGTRIAMLLGRNTYENMIPVNYQEKNIQVSGFISRPGITRSRRREQRVIVNGRPAQADTVFFGIRDAYHTLVMKGRYPPVILYIDTPPDQVDVNVHPTKREVRFRNGRLVGQVVAAAIRHALQELANETGLSKPEGTGHQASENDRHSDPPGQKTREKEERENQFEFSPDGIDFHPLTEEPPSQQSEEVQSPRNNEQTKPEEAQHSAGVEPQPGDSQSFDPTAPSKGEQEDRQEPASPSDSDVERKVSGSAATRPEIQNLRIIGTIRSLYLLGEGRTGLVLIDQHAAHERILFEKLLAASRQREHKSQPLLFPVTVELSPHDINLLNNSLDSFTSLGFGLDFFGGNAYIVSALPVDFPQENVEGLLHDMLEELRESPDRTIRPDETRIAQAACKHAVRSEDPLAKDEITHLLQDLAKTEMPYTCPHGRPVMINIPDSELEKRFGRRK
ncbi:MAG: DNA mismatch repair endonuclease MutL [Lentisphaeria bacterium]